MTFVSVAGPKKCREMSTISPRCASRGRSSISTPGTAPGAASGRSRSRSWTSVANPRSRPSRPPVSSTRPSPARSRYASPSLCISSSTTTEAEVLWSATGAPSSLCADKPSMIAATCASPSGARSWVRASTGVGAPLLTVTVGGRGTSGNVTGASPSGRPGWSSVTLPPALRPRTGARDSAGAAPRLPVLTAGARRRLTRMADSGAYVQAGQEYTRDTQYIETRITADGRDGYPVERGRYRLIAARACPWANRTIIVRRLLGLEDAISMGLAGPTHDARSWTFDLDPGGVDPVLGIERLQQAYFARVPDYPRGITVPAIVDVPSGAVVTNDFAQITLDFSTEWTQYHRDGAPDLYPDHLRAEIDEVAELVYQDVNNGVYRCGFAGSQRAYDRAYDQLLARLDWLSEQIGRASRRGREQRGEL